MTAPESGDARVGAVRDGRAITEAPKSEVRQGVQVTGIDIPFGQVLALVWKIAWAWIIVGIPLAILATVAYYMVVGASRA